MLAACRSLKASDGKASRHSTETGESMIKSGDRMMVKYDFVSCDKDELDVQRGMYP